MPRRPYVPRCRPRATRGSWPPCLAASRPSKNPPQPQFLNQCWAKWKSLYVQRREQQTIVVRQQVPSKQLDAVRQGGFDQFLLEVEHPSFGSPDHVLMLVASGGALEQAASDWKCGGLCPGNRFARPWSSRTRCCSEANSRHRYIGRSGSSAIAKFLSKRNG